MKKYKKILVIIIIALISFTGCKKSENDQLKEKISSELEYLNIKIIDILNALNNLSFENYTLSIQKSESNVSVGKQSTQKESGSEGGSGEQSEGGGEEKSGQSEEESQELVNTTEMVTNSTLERDKENVKWDLIKPEIELLNENWSVILLDLYSLNVNNNTILDFGKKLDDCIITIKNEDKTQSLNNLADLYAMIPIFLREINGDENVLKIRETQSYLITAYSKAQDMGNMEINNNVEKAIEKYSEIMSNIDYISDKTYKTNKIYVLLNELKNSLEKQDEDLFYIKYKTVLEELLNLE